MTAPNMAAITASLERSLQNCSLDHPSSAGADGSIDDSSTSDLPDNNLPVSDATLELNSQISLPYHWEQCLDLKTGEIYYINWRNGMKAKEDPRTLPVAEFGGDLYSEDDSSYDSEGSWTESSPSSSREKHGQGEKDNVLVVAGCKSCLMYFMVPKQVEECPKCSGHLLHFDRSDSDNGCP